MTAAIAAANEAVASQWFQSRSETRDEAAPWTRRVSALIFVSALARYVFIASTGLTDTEAYYVSWARFPAWSYYDHAPGTAWLVRAAEWLLGGAYAARLVPAVCAAATAWLLFRLGTLLFSPRAGFLAALFTVASPFYFFIGFLVNPEGPLAPMWLLFLLLLYGLRTQHEWWRPSVLGAVLGLAFLSKYTGILLLPIALAFVAMTPSARGWLRRPSFYLAGVVALVVAMPVVAWNLAHHWPTLHLHLVERLSAVSGPPLAQRFFHFARDQWLMFQPLLVPGFLAALVWCLLQARRDDRFRLLALASVLPGAFLAFVMVRARDAEPHWTMVVYLSLAVAAGGWLDLNLHRLGRWTRRYLAVSLTSSAVFISLTLVHALSPQLAPSLPGYVPGADPINETIGWSSLREVLRARADRLGPEVAVVGSHNVLCGQLLEQLSDLPKVYCVSPTRTAFDFLGRGQPPAGVPVLYVDSARYRFDPARLLPDRVCHDVDSLDIKRGSLSVGRFRIAECTAPQPGQPEDPLRRTGGGGLVAAALDDLASPKEAGQ
jgi:4-amino-4-deoxy-L-arabinose transferase-like glycosyltransferase